MRSGSLFLSTPSARRATQLSVSDTHHWTISIHALREEGDPADGLPEYNEDIFLSTPSARRATSKATDAAPCHKISIHALREEGDEVPEPLRPYVIKFLSTPSARRATFATSVRVWNFSKKETVIAFQFAQPEETDARATKILITPTWKIEGAVAKVEACNNAFDAVPTWEDITAMVQLNRVFNFTNETKTADKWGVNVRFTIVKNEGYEGEVSISGFGGAYE